MKKSKRNTYAAGLLINCILNTNQSFAQNTSTYTDPEQYYKRGIELFEKRAFTASREELLHFIKLTNNKIEVNDFTIQNAEYYSALAALYSNSKNASIEIERFVLKNSNHPKAKLIYYELGKHFFDKAEYEQAIIYLERASQDITYSDKNLEIRYKLGVSYYLTNNYDKALEQFDFVKKNASEFTANAYYYSGVINFAKENLDIAYTDLKQIENVQPYKIEIPNWICNILYKQKRFDELINYAEQVLEKPNGRKIDEVSLLAAEVCFFQDRFDKAAKYYDKFRNFKKGSVSEQITFRHAFSLYKTENYVKAAEYFKKIANLNTELGQQAAYYLGISSLKNNDRNAALIAFERAKAGIFDKKIKEEAQFNFAKVSIEMGSNQAGISELQDYLKMYPDGKYEDEVNEILSEVLFDANNYTQAILYIESLKRKTAKINAAYQKLCFNQGVLDFNAERYSKSIEYFSKSIDKSVDTELRSNALFWRAEASFAINSELTESYYKEVLGTSGELLKQKSRYALGYLNYNKKEYRQAIMFFKDFLNGKKDAGLQQNYEDVLLRLGDCYLVTKSYTDALTYYDKASKENHTEMDYANYQKALVLSFLGRTQESKQIFEKVVSQFPNSRFSDDALYQSGLIELDKDNFQSAIQLFTKIIRERPKSIQVPNALSKRALAYANVKNYEASILDYKQILQKYGNSTVAEDALLGLQQNLNIVGRPEDFIAMIEDFKKNNPENGTVESLEFDAAKNLYLNEKYGAANVALQKFIKNYPNNSNAFEAKYLIADGYYLLGEKNNALKYYYQVISDNNTTYVSKSALRAASIEYANKNLKNAITNYRVVTQTSQNKREIVSAWQGMSESYFQMSNQDSTIYFAREILNNGGSIVMGAPNRAQLLIGKSYLQKNDYVRAEEELTKVLLLAKDNTGAEAKYLIGESQYKTKKYKESIKTLQELSQSFSEFVFWYEKSFLLIADNYIALNDYFMAKATLKSIIENADSQEIIESAKIKLKNIENKD